jgi:hypothetical protein
MRPFCPARLTSEEGPMGYTRSGTYCIGGQQVDANTIDLGPATSRPL